MTSPGDLHDAGKASLEAIRAASPELVAVAAAVRADDAIVNEKCGRKKLEPWNSGRRRHQGARPPLGPRAHQEAVINGLSLSWSSGFLEGHGPAPSPRPLAD